MAIAGEPSPVTPRRRPCAARQPPTLGLQLEGPRSASVRLAGSQRAPCQGRAGRVGIDRSPRVGEVRGAMALFAPRRERQSPYGKPESQRAARAAGLAATKSCTESHIYTESASEAWTRERGRRRAPRALGARLGGSGRAPRALGARLSGHSCVPMLPFHGAHASRRRGPWSARIAGDPVPEGPGAI